MIFDLFESPYTRAQEKAMNPHMTLRDNPLADHGDCAKCNMMKRNMSRLEQDAEIRRNPATGRVYAGIMNNRFGG